MATSLAKLWECSDGSEGKQARGILGAQQGRRRRAKKKEKQGSRTVGAPRGVDEHAGDLSTSRRARAAKQLRG
jgi:hypothetical protein